MFCYWPDLYDPLQGKATWDKLFESPNFFGKYRHFIVLEASATTEEDQLEWYGLVESKVRHLILNLEREAIDLAHVWPKTYPSLEEGREKTCCYWFVGLALKTQASEDGTKAQNLDLTTPIKSFTETLMRAAVNITVSSWIYLCFFNPGIRQPSCSHQAVIRQLSSSQQPWAIFRAVIILQSVIVLPLRSLVLWNSYVREI